MTSRVTGFGLAALLAGVALLVLTDGLALTAAGAVLLVVGAGIAATAGLRGVHDSPEASRRAAAADERRDAETGAQHKRAMETGRWPRVIGGG